MPGVKMPTEKLDEMMIKEEQMLKELTEIEETEDEIMKSLGEIKKAMNLKQVTRSKASKNPKTGLAKVTPIVEEGTEVYLDSIEDATEADDKTGGSNVFDTLAAEVGAVNKDVQAIKDKMNTLEAMMAQIIELVTSEPESD